MGSCSGFSSPIAHVMMGFCRNHIVTYFPKAKEEQIAAAVRDRERIMHTGLPNGLAVPHARLDALKKPHIFIARSEQGVDFHASDGYPAHIICMLLTPTDQPETQIELLGLFAEAFKTVEARQRARRAKTPTEFFAAINLASSKPAEELVPHDDA